MQRRHLVKTAAFTALSASRIKGANEKVNVALIGCGGRGRYVATLMRQAPGTAYTAAADVYQTNANLTKEWAGPGAQAFQDFRKILDLKDVDAVHIATPDHWHGIISVLACQAGKDVYVEKPTSLTVREGRVMVNAARQHKRIVQVGTQHRSAPHFAKIAEIIQKGDIGEVKFVRVWNYSNQSMSGLARNVKTTAPGDLDWDMYLGPSPKVPYDSRRFLATYRYFWDYSGGYITDFGNHRLDTMQQIMGVTAPQSISASGGLYCIKDGRETPDLMQVTYDYGNFLAVYEGNNLNGHGIGGRTPGHKYYNARTEADQPNGIAFHGTEATIYAERIGWEMFPEPTTPPFVLPGDTPPPPKRRAASVKRMWENNEEPTKLHCANFIDCVRSRKTPNADIEIGHRSTSVALLGNISMRTGKKLQWDARKEQFTSAPDANAMLTRPLRKPWDLIKL